MNANGILAINIASYINLISMATRGIAAWFDTWEHIASVISCPIYYLCFELQFCSDVYNAISSAVQKVRIFTNFILHRQNLLNWTTLLISVRPLNTKVSCHTVWKGLQLFTSWCSHFYHRWAHNIEFLTMCTEESCVAICYRTNTRTFITTASLHFTSITTSHQWITCKSLLSSLVSQLSFFLITASALSASYSLTLLRFWAFLYNFSTVFQF